MRKGVEPDLTKLQARLDAAAARAGEVAELLSAAQAAALAITHERLQLLVDRHSEFTALAEAETARGEELRAVLASCALDVGDQRVVIQNALALMFAGHPGNYPGKTHQDEEARKAHFRTFEPWAQTGSPRAGAFWSAIELVTTPPGA